MTNERLVELWMLGKTASQIAEESDTTTANIYQRIKYLRDSGLDIPDRSGRAKGVVIRDTRARRPRKNGIDFKALERVLDSMQETCPHCDGTGKVSTDDHVAAPVAQTNASILKVPASGGCAECDGRGFVMTMVKGSNVVTRVACSCTSA